MVTPTQVSVAEISGCTKASWRCELKTHTHTLRERETDTFVNAVCQSLVATALGRALLEISCSETELQESRNDMSVSLEPMLFSILFHVVVLYVWYVMSILFPFSKSYNTNTRIDRKLLNAKARWCKLRCQKRTIGEVTLETKNQPFRPKCFVQGKPRLDRRPVQVRRLCHATTVVPVTSPCLSCLLKDYIGLLRYSTLCEQAHA